MSRQYIAPPTSSRQLDQYREKYLFDDVAKKFYTETPDPVIPKKVSSSVNPAITNEGVASQQSSITNEQYQMTPEELSGGVAGQTAYTNRIASLRAGGTTAPVVPAVAQPVQPKVVNPPAPTTPATSPIKTGSPLVQPVAQPTQPPTQSIAQPMETPATQPTQGADLGFPKSSRELDQWVAQGRTFQNGKWIEGAKDNQDIGDMGAEEPTKPTDVNTLKQQISEVQDALTNAKTQLEKENALENIVQFYAENGMSFPANLIESILSADTKDITDFKEDLRVKYNLDDLETRYLERPTQTYEEIYKSVLEGSGYSDLTVEINKLKDSIAKEEATRDATLSEIADDPWLPQASMLGRQKREYDRSEGVLNRLTNQLTLALNLQDRAINNAKEVANRSLDAYNLERKLREDEYNMAIERANADLNAELTLRETQTASDVYRYFPEFSNAYTPKGSGNLNAPESNTLPKDMKYISITTPAGSPASMPININNVTTNDIDKMRAGGLNDNDITSWLDTNTKLTKSSIDSLVAGVNINPIEESALTEAWFISAYGQSEWNKINKDGSVLNTIDLYRKAGYSDKQILDLMQSE